MIDELDLALVDALRVDPRAPWSKLARPLGVDPATLSRRWARLSASGDAWVAGYPSADRTDLGLIALVAVECQADAVASVASELAADPQAATIELVSGGADLLVTVAALTREQLTDYVLDRMSRLPGVLRTTISFVERTLREGSRWSDGALDPQQRAAITPDSSERDPALRPARAVLRDRRLLHALGEDGRMPYAVLGQRLGQPATTVRRRVAELRDSGQLVLRCDASPRLTGHPLGTMLWLDLPAHRLEAAALWLCALPQTRMCAVTVGSANLVAYLVTRGFTETRRVEEELSRRFPECRVRDRQVTLRTAKLVGRLLDPDGRAVGYVPIDPWAPQAARPTAGG
ncbi:DNA-binding Lrp family transcriptional regulator [Kitasatospora sp. MAA4]|uniref:Lrp/AsnC family transcriptional regulator n=1 Tax=Kitasatospora sp. MAA4 TaxID=3035093 RepID=UPI002473A007|nr:Lrp/AsnC family transcriptional regulator [Kitasatospora sp. MAA4]MDH6134118.1 DNA-binding Lrp family transcriptional regulator [Kitasatospora sp. MAA4]